MPITPQHIDSVATDTSANIKEIPVYYAPAYIVGFPDSTDIIQPISQIDQLPIMEESQGREPMGYIDTPLKSGGTVILIICAFLFLALSYRKGYKYLMTLSHNLFSVKKRQNMFDDHTLNETQTLISLIINTCVLEGILLYFAISTYNPTIDISTHVLLSVLSCVGIAGLYYIVQLIAYFVLGSVFGDKHGTRLWIEGYNASQSFLGLALLPVTLIIIVYPDTASTTLICSLILYLCARIVFICKGFRIFFNNLSSSLYFILYLCSVEIVPAILSYTGAIVLCKLIHS